MIIETFTFAQTEVITTQKYRKLRTIPINPLKRIPITLNL